MPLIRFHTYIPDRFLLGQRPHMKDQIEYKHLFMILILNDETDKKPIIIAVSMR